MRRLGAALLLSSVAGVAAQATAFRGAPARAAQLASRRMTAASVSVRVLGRSFGFLEDITVYEVKGVGAEELGRALKTVRVRDSAGGVVNKVHEHDFDEVRSLALARPLQVPTALVVKVNESYYGGGFFGPVWGRFVVETVGDAVFVKDFVRGSPVYRAGHHLFASGVQAITRAVERLRADAAAD